MEVTVKQGQVEENVAPPMRGEKGGIKKKRKRVALWLR
jgi:hypothetical protein